MSNPEQVYEQRQAAYLVWSDAVSHLEGQLLTLVEAVSVDPEQRRAIKSMLSPMLWQWILQQGQLKSEGVNSPKFTLINPFPTN